METLFSGMGENIGRFAAHLFSAAGWPAWLLMLIPAGLAAVPLLSISPVNAPHKTKIARGLVAALPAFWVAVCAIVVTFTYNEKFDRYLVSQVVFWVFVALTVLMMLSGLAAIVLIKGWHRLTALALVVLNLWIIAACAFMGIMMVSGSFL